MDATPKFLPVIESIVFRQILVAVDGSVDAQLDLTHAIDLAAYTHSHLTLFTAFEQPSRFGCWGPAAPSMFSFFKRAETEAEGIAGHARDRVPEQVRATTLLRRQPVKPALLSEIIDGHHDVVVMGARGRNRSRSTVLGSIANDVLRHSTAPVLILHPESRRHNADGSATSANAPTVRPPTHSAQTA